MLNGEFLSGIVASTRQEIEAAMSSISLKDMKARALDQPAALSLGRALQGTGIRIIAEIKRASPSKGLLRSGLDPAFLAAAYAQNGAAAISVLTERHHFAGSLEDLRAARRGLEGTSLPLLRKDFILDPCQVYQARAFGADAFLLIAAILEDQKLADLLALGRDLGMECLLEVHDQAEAERAVALGAEIIGINNRDLRTFKVDIETTGKLRPLLPPDRIVVSESGIRTRQDLEKLAEWQVQAVLIGEALVTAPDPGKALRELAWSE